MPPPLIHLAPAIVLVGLSCLPHLRVPTLTGWKLTLLAGEFGHFLAAGSLVLAIAAGWRARANGPFGWIATVLLAISTTLFLVPSILAARIATGLPAAMNAAFGHTTHIDTPFRLRELIAWGEPAVKVETHVYAHASTADELALDFYRAAQTGNASTVPCVIAVHGGGWDGGARDQLPGLYHRLAARGFSVAAISYRLAPRNPWPAQREDVLAAIAFLKENATQLGIDPMRLVLLGRSAGGQIATAVGYTAHDPAIRGVVAFYAPHDMNFAWSYGRADDVLNSILLLSQYLGGTPDLVPANFDDASAILHVQRGLTPPTLLVHGSVDTLVWRRQSERLAERLLEEHVPHVFLELPWATHAFDFNLHGPGGQLATWALEHFLRSVTD